MKKLWEGMKEFIETIVCMPFESLLLVGLTALAIAGYYRSNIRWLVFATWIVIYILPIPLYFILVHIENILNKLKKLKSSIVQKKRNWWNKLMRWIRDGIGSYMVACFSCAIYYVYFLISLIILLASKMAYIILG